MYRAQIAFQIYGYLLYININVPHAQLRNEPVLHNGSAFAHSFHMIEQWL